MAQVALVQVALAIDLVVEQIAVLPEEAPAAFVTSVAQAACAVAAAVDEFAAVSAVPVVPGSVAGPIAAPASLGQ